MAAIRCHWNGRKICYWNRIVHFRKAFTLTSWIIWWQTVLQLVLCVLRYQQPSCTTYSVVYFIFIFMCWSVWSLCHLKSLVHQTLIEFSCHSSLCCMFSPFLWVACVRLWCPKLSQSAHAHFLPFPGIDLFQLPFSRSVTTCTCTLVSTSPPNCLIYILCQG